MQVTSEYQEGRLTVALEGELDQHAIRESAGAIDRLLEEYLPMRLVLDLQNLTFMDSSGIALILRLHRRMRHCGSRGMVVTAGGQPLRVLEAAGIERMVPVEEAEDSSFLRAASGVSRERLRGSII